MNENAVKIRRPSAERGAAGVKFLIVALILISIAHAAYNYIPVAYQGQSFKQEMETQLVKGLTMPGNGATPVDAIKNRLTRAVAEYQLPPALIEVKQVNNVITAHVKYSQQVNILPFGIYKYNYEFDHTATPSGFLTKQ